MSKFAPERVRRFRRSVYSHPTIPLGCKLMLIRMSEDVDGFGHVCIPRAKLATYLHVSPQRVTEWVKAAKLAGFLSPVRRGEPGVTAVYGLLTAGPESVPTWPDSA